MREHLSIPTALDGSAWRYRNPGYSNKQHRHAELEPNLVTRGTGTYLLANRRYQIRRGDLLWLFPAQEHVLLELTADFEMWVAVFRRKAIRRVSGDAAAKVFLGQDSAQVCCRRLSVMEHRGLDGWLAELAANESRPALFNAGLSYALLQAWQCFEGAEEVPVRDVHPAVERAARLISDDATGVSLERMARRAGLSSARLSRLFHQQTGMTMVEFRNRQRISRFLDLYGTGARQTMLDAALDSGFGSYAQFHRVFRGVLGCSPGAYRRRVSDV
jgi:AraC-like DNA-binding protein